MDFGISTLCFGTGPLTVDRLERLRLAGFSQIEVHAAPGAFDFHNRSLVRGVARWFLENELPAPSIHLPFELDVTASGPMERQKALDEVKRCLEFADLLPVRYAVLHLGVPGQKFHPAIFDHAYRAIATIQSFSGVMALIETLRNEIATAARILEFKTAAQIPNVGICYDTGHGEWEVEGGTQAIHLNDNNDGGEDDHLWPFDGTRDWPLLVERLGLPTFAGPLVFEVRDDDLVKAADCRSRLRDLMDEAQDSIEEFRLKYKLPIPKHEGDE